MHLRWLALLWMVGCTEVDGGSLCTNEDVSSLEVVFTTCRSSARNVHVESCETELDEEGVLRVKTRYRASGSSNLPDCQVDRASCDLPEEVDGSLELQHGDRTTTLGSLPLCSDFIDW